MRNYIIKKPSKAPLALVKDKRLSREARFLYVYLTCRPLTIKFKDSDIERDLCFSNSTRLKYMKELTDSGWVVIEKKYDEFKRNTFNAMTINKTLD